MHVAIPCTHSACRRGQAGGCRRYSVLAGLLYVGGVGGWPLAVRSISLGSGQARHLGSPGRRLVNEEAPSGYTSWFCGCYAFPCGLLYCDVQSMGR